MRKQDDRRQERRLAFSGETPASALNGASEISMETMDISRKGLGVVLYPSPTAGDEIQLHFHNKRIPSLRFKVKHVYKETLDGGRARCGIELHEQHHRDIDLIELFTRYDK